MIGQELRKKILEAFAQDEFDENSLKASLLKVNGVESSDCDELIVELKRYHQVLSQHQRSDVLKLFDDSGSVKD